MNHADLAPFLRCPTCRRPFARSETLTCANGHRFEERDDIPVLLAETTEDFKTHEAEFWNHQYAGEDPRAAARDLAFHRAFRRPFETLPKDSILLEVGCGVRADSLELAKKGFRVVATDISERALRDARAFAREKGGAERMTFLAADAERLPFADGTFSGCLIAASLHHLPHPLEGLREMRRVVKPGGIVVAAVEPNAWPYYALYPLLKPVKKLIRARRKRGIDSVADDQTKGFTRGQLRKLFETAGLKVERILPAKFTGELYDSGMRLMGGLTRRHLEPALTVQRVLARFDEFLGRALIIRHLAWHWTVVARVR